MPDPSFTTVNWCWNVNVAVTVTSSFSVTVQLPVPLHAPDHPVKAEPATGVAVRVTGWPFRYGDEHACPQSMPWGCELTVPVPLPAVVTVSRGWANVAVT